MSPAEVIHWLCVGGWSMSVLLAAIGLWMRRGHPDARLRAAWVRFEMHALGCSITFAVVLVLFGRASP